MNGRQHLNQLRYIKSLILDSPTDTDTTFLLYVTFIHSTLSLFSGATTIHFFDNIYALY